MKRSLGVPQLALIVAILGLTILLTALTADVTRVSEPGIRLVNGQPYLPETVGNWVSTAVDGLSEVEKKLLPADTGGIRRRYVNPDGREINCSVIVAGRDVSSIHRPELCLPGQGWNIQRENVEEIKAATAPGGELKVMRMDAFHSVAQAAPGRPVRTIFVYWFVGKDRTTPHHWERILWTTSDRVLFNRNHRWAYLLIASPVRPEMTAEALERAQADTMGLLTQFVEQLYPMMRPSQSE